MVVPSEVALRVERINHNLCVLATIVAGIDFSIIAQLACVEWLLRDEGEKFSLHRILCKCA